MNEEKLTKAKIKEGRTLSAISSMVSCTDDGSLTMYIFLHYTENDVPCDKFDYTRDEFNVYQSDYRKLEDMLWRATI